MPANSSDALEARVRRIEDELAIQRVVLSYGPAADAGASSLAASGWLDDGAYDWDAAHSPIEGRDGVDRMLQSDGHRRLIANGAAHFAGPLLIEVDADTATAVNYSLIMLREEDRFFLWRVSAVRWDLERRESTWRIRCRTNRVLDESGAGRELFGDALDALFDCEPGQ